MPKPRNLIPTRRLNLHLREDLFTKIELLLFSELEQRVPEGAYRQWFELRIQEYLNSKHLDLAPWADSPPGAFIVSGTPEAMRALEKTLTELSLETTK